MSQSPHSRKKTEMAARRRIVADLYLREQKSQPEIAAQLGVDHSQISRDLLELRKQWMREAVGSISLYKAEELAKVDRLELEYYTAWARSKQNAEIEVIEQIGKRKQAQKGEPEPPELVIVPDRIKKYSRSEGQSGNPAFLAGIQWCIDKRCEILGLDAADSKPLSYVDLNKLSNEQLQRLANGDSIWDVLASTIQGDSNPETKG